MTRLPEVKAQAPPEPAAGRPARKSRRWELVGYAFLGLFTTLAAVAYELLAERAGWAVGFGASILLLEAGLIGFCLLTDRGP